MKRSGPHLGQEPQDRLCLLCRALTSLSKMSFTSVPKRYNVLPPLPLCPLWTPGHAGKQCPPSPATMCLSVLWILGVSAACTLELPI